MTIYGKFESPCRKVVISRDYSASCNFFLLKSDKCSRAKGKILLKYGIIYSDYIGSQIRGGGTNVIFQTFSNKIYLRRKSTKRLDITKLSQAKSQLQLCWLA